MPIVVNTLPSQFNFNEINSITGGGGHTMITLTNGDVYCCGLNSNGQLGYLSNQTASTDRENFHKITKCQNIKKVSCGWDNTALLTQHGEALVWGNNKQHQLGVVDSSSQINSQLLNGSKIITDLTLGFRFIAFTTLEGRVFFSGDSKCMKIISNLPNACTETIDGVKFTEIKLPSRALSVAAGQHHVIIQTDERELTVFGDNKFGQCGEKNDCNIITFGHKIQHIACGWTHSAVLDERGQVYLWGRNDYSQLGQGTAEPFISTPKLLPLDNRAKQLWLGSEHGLVLTDTGEVFSWGWNEHGNCGVGSVENVQIPTKVKLEGKACLIGTGAGFNFALVIEHNFS